MPKPETTTDVSATPAVLVARVAVSAATFVIDKLYDYLVPPEMAALVRPGVRVIVPFARGNRRVEGIVLAVADESKFAKPKLLDSVVDAEPILSPEQIRLALWMRERFFCTVYEAVRAMLPTALWQEISYQYRIADGFNRPKAELAITAQAASAQTLTDARAVLDMLFAASDVVAEQKLQKELGQAAATRGLRHLLAANVAERLSSAKQRTGDKEQKVLTLAVLPEDALDFAARKQNSARVQAEVMTLLASAGSVSAKEVGYYTGATAATYRALERAGLITIETQEVFRRPKIQARQNAPGKELTTEQQTAADGLLALYQSSKPEAALLHGVTGSGKTAVYLNLIDRVLKDNKAAIVLVPEIALTPQLMGNFAARFGDKVAVLHSALGVGERYDEWKRIRNGDAPVVVGTRSAVFAPIPKLGVIVIDEEQEHTYKSESTPRYHARDVAKFRCVQENALLVLGSATPAVETMFAAKAERYHYFPLKTRYNQMALPEVMIADMRENLKAGNSTNLSFTLREELAKNISAGEQSILFLNRRGTSNLVVCGECGFTYECEQCSVGLTYHQANERLMCHYCGASRVADESCPDCGGILKHVGAGTQRVQAELSELFPRIEILRMDTDTITPAMGHDALLARFERKNIPILIGTQMVTKGLDFARVTLVGIIFADQGLYVSDYRAQERSFSLITQVIGRAGRGATAGRAVLQTFTPKHEVIELAAQQDYDAFYEREITMRRLQNAPPLLDFISITGTGANEATVLRCVADIGKALKRCPLGEGAEVIGPAPAGVLKVSNRYRYRLILRCRNTKQVRAQIADILRRAMQAKAYRGVTVYGDSTI